MSSRKRPGFLSERTIRRYIAAKKAKLYQEADKAYAQVISNLPSTSNTSVNCTRDHEMIKDKKIESCLLDTQMIETDTIRVLFSEPPSNSDSLCNKNSNDNLFYENENSRENEIPQFLNDTNHHVFESESVEDTEFDDEYISSVLKENADQAEIIDFFSMYINEEDKEYSNGDYNYVVASDTKWSEQKEKEEKDEKFINEFRDSCFTAIGPIAHSVVNKQLAVLNKFTDTKFPKDARTLFKTPRSTKIYEMGNGHYWHNDLKSIVMAYATTYIEQNIEERCIQLLANIDGAPLARNSDKGVWIISCSETILKDVDTVGIYHGPDKPKDSNELVKMFVDEITILINDGIDINGIHFSVVLFALICDTPAKAYILKVKYHTGYWSCTKCKIKGVYEGKMTFPGKKLPDGSILTKVNPPRTDEGFKNFEYKGDGINEGYQQGETIFVHIPKFGCVSNVAIDYMHIICLRILLTLYVLWQKGPLKVRLIVAQRQEMNAKLASIALFMPSDFDRKPREFKNIERTWRAHDFRRFLLYTGPVVLRDKLDEDAYKNFLTLHVAATIVANPLLCKNEEYLNLAEDLTDHFVEEYQHIYGAINVTHSVHTVLHLVEDVRKFGAIDAFSAFRFESHIPKIKALLKKGDKLLQQIARRTAEIKTHKQSSIKDASTSEVVLSKSRDDGPIESFSPLVKQFQILEKGSVKIDSINVRNNCVLLKDGLYVDCCNFVEDTDGKKYIIGKELKAMSSFYNTPIDSALLNIKVANPPCKKYGIFPCDFILAKVCKVLDGKSFVLFPLIHTYEDS